MKNFTRLFALALSAAMTWSLLVTGAAAADPGGASYSDVPSTASYYEAVEYLAANKIMDGIGDGRFGPKNTVNRAMVVTVLGRMAKAAEVETNQFTDVAPNSWYSGYVGWAADNGIVQGDGNGHFMPDQMVTSEHLNLMLTRYAQLNGRSVVLYDTGADSVTRADLAQRLYQFFLRADADEPMIPVVHQAPGGTIANTARDSSVTFPAVWWMGYRDNGVYTFKDIKYGTAERFKQPAPYQPAQSNSETSPLPAMTNGPVPPQADTRTNNNKDNSNFPVMTPSDSDMFADEAGCLNLNVWTTSLDTAAKKPVLVFMHGGGYTTGSSIELKSYNGDQFAKYTDTVFVSVGARLNVLGYSDLSALGGDPNLALADMVLSLEWVKANISAFGGDPDNVTIMGQSGGGMKVSALASAPKALEEDLFQKVVSSSGFGASAATAETTAEAAGRVADNVRGSGLFASWLSTEKPGTSASSASEADVFAFLQSVDYDDLLGFGISTGTFTRDGEYFDNAGSFMVGDELNETARNYTYMVGHTWGEMAGRSSDGGIIGNAPNNVYGMWSESQKETFMRDFMSTRVGGYEETKELFESLYPDHEFIELYATTGSNTLNLGNRDYTLSSGLASGLGYCTRMAQSVNDGQKVYGYLSAYTMPMYGGTTMIHTVDLTYFFHNTHTAPQQIHGDEANARMVSDVMALSLAAFCRSGDPSAAGLECRPYSASADGASYCTIYDVDSRSVDITFNAELLRLIQTAS